jgi:plasmid stability protein
VPDVLIRDLPDEVVAAIDAKAQRLGLSRNEYLRRQLTGASHAERPRVTVEDLQRSARTFADVEDPEVMVGAWS